MSILSPVHVEASSLPEPIPEVRRYTEEECNCYLYVKRFIPEFPRTIDLIPNSIYPVVQGVIILTYAEVSHYAIVTKVVEGGIYIKESNFGGCGFKSRFLTWEYLKEKKAQYWYEDI